MKHTLKKQWAGSEQRVGTGSGNTYREYSDKCRVEQAIMQSNSARFRMTENTPPYRTLFSQT